MSTLRLRWCALATVVLLLVAGAVNLAAAAPAAKQIMVPGEDRFTPFAVTVHIGQKVTWTNNDTDSHYVVSDDAFNTAGHKGVNHLLPPGASYSLKFSKAGVFPFYCSFHSKLDADNQPKAPGPFGGIQDQDGNFGTPMSGVVTVIP
jgi:plastocyanin